MQESKIKSAVSDEELGGKEKHKKTNLALDDKPLAYFSRENLNFWLREWNICNGGGEHAYTQLIFPTFACYSSYA